jgi:hypothetical protein
MIPVAPITGALLLAGANSIPPPKSSQFKAPLTGLLTGTPASV